MYFKDINKNGIVYILRDDFQARETIMMKEIWESFKSFHGNIFRHTHRYEICVHMINLHEMLTKAALRFMKSAAAQIFGHVFKYELFLSYKWGPKVS